MERTLRAEVVAIGDELTTGQRLDTNSRWIARELSLLGIPVALHTTVPDTMEDGIAAFRAAADRASVVVATGGLGPTADDLTRDVLAAVAGVPLEPDAAAIADLEARFARRGVAMPESNRRQAHFPRGSRIIPNPEGTAPGIDIELPAGGPRVFALPGVPSEMRAMWEGTVAPAIAALVPGGATTRFRRVKCFGAGESAVEAMLPDIVRRGRDPLVGITVHEATITLRIAARAGDGAAALAAIEPTERLIRDALGDLVYGTEDDEIEDAALSALSRAGGRLATVEAGTRGRLAALVAEGAARRREDLFAGAVVLPPEDPRVADVVEAARRRRDEAGASHGLAVGPVAEGEGPAVEIALAAPEGSFRVLHRLGGAADVRLVRAAKTALDVVRRHLLGRPLVP